MREYYKKVDNETINELMTSLEENEKAIRDMNEERGFVLGEGREVDSGRVRQGRDVWRG